MEPNIPVGSPAGIASAMQRAVAGATREQQAGASGKWVAHWKMVHIVRPVWEREGAANQRGRPFPALTYTPADADDLLVRDDAPRTVRGARDLLSVGLQYGNAFGQGMQAAALKPADFFGNDDVLYLMEDMATGEIRLSILWEWVHKGATVDGEPFTLDRFTRLLEEEHAKLLGADPRDVHDDSKTTTLPIARAIVDRYVREPIKLPWYIDLLNLTLGTNDLGEARRRIDLLARTFAERGTRLTTLVQAD
jgi:malate synthase